MTIRETKKEVVFYEWDCPGCGKLIGTQDYPIFEERKFCLDCQNTNYQKRKQAALEDFQTKHGYLYGITVVSIEPDSSALGTKNYVHIESVTVSDDNGNVYSIRADEDFLRITRKV